MVNFRKFLLPNKPVAYFSKYFGKSTFAPMPTPVGLGRSALVGDVAAAELGANLAADRTGRVFGVVSPVRVPRVLCAVQHGEVALFWTLVRSLESI